jgi:AcrR family transcriptional regulator
VRDLARVVGIQSGSLFHHFKTKEDILCAVMEEAITYNTARMREAVEQGGSTRDKLLGLIRAELESINGDTGDAMAVLFFEWQGISADKQKLLLEMRSRYESYWLDVLTAAHGEGLITHDPFLWRRLLSGAIAWTVMWYKRQGPVSVAELAEMTLDMALCQK